MAADDVGKGRPHPRRGTRARRERLAQLLVEQGSQIALRDLQEHFEVSEATLRRDLAALSESGKLVRVYGGAAPARGVESTWREKAASYAESKVRIAQFAAAELVLPGDIVFIDSGTTPAAVARQLAAREDLTIVVGGLASLLELADGTVDVIVLGGRLRRKSASFLGQAADHLLDLIAPDVAFLGTDHLDPANGANFPDLEQAIFKSRVIARSTRSWFVADESKFGESAPFRHWTPIEPPTGIVTMATTNEQAQRAIRAFRQCGCTVHELSPS